MPSVLGNIRVLSCVLLLFEVALTNRLFQQCAAGLRVGGLQVRSAVSRYENTVPLTMIATPLLMARAADLSSPRSSVDHPAP